MRLKTILLLLVVLVIALVLLIVSYVFSKYSISVDIPEVRTEGFVAFFEANQLFVVAAAVIFVVLVGIMLLHAAK